MNVPLEQIRAIKPLPISMLAYNDRYLIIGNSKDGKTTVARELVGYINRANTDEGRRGFTWAFVMSGTEDSTGNWAGVVEEEVSKTFVDADGVTRTSKRKIVKQPYGVVPRFMVRTTFSEEMVKSVYERQKYLWQTYNHRDTVMIIGDDVFGGTSKSKNMDEKASASQTMDQLAKFARNDGVGMMLIIHQVTNEVSTSIREVVHWVIIGAGCNKQHIYELIIQRNISKRSWDDLWAHVFMRGEESKHVFLVFRKLEGNDFSDKYFTFRAKDPRAPTHKIPHLCALGYWAIHARLKNGTTYMFDEDEKGDNMSQLLNDGAEDGRKAPAPAPAPALPPMNPVYVKLLQKAAAINAQGALQRAQAKKPATEASPAAGSPVGPSRALVPARKGILKQPQPVFHMEDDLP